MKEGSSLREEMIERNWVLKRKRKHISSGLDASTKKQGDSILGKSSSSLRKKLKRDIDASQKLKGHDGYYFECEECALGGNLLCCDSCPRTYHLDCLKPPLKRAPPGKWQCPNCCEQKVGETLINVETSSGRTKSKNTIQKARAVDSISSSGKASHSSRSSIGRNNSTRKRKASISSGVPAFEKNPSSSSMKSSPSGDNLLMVGASETSETADGKTMKKTVSPQRKKMSVQKVRSLAKSSNSNASDSIIEESDAYKNGNHGNKINIPAILSSRISKKNRKMICRIEKTKRSKIAEVENVGCVSNDISSEASPCPESSGPHQKCSPTDNRRMSKSKQERRLLKSAMQKQLEISPHAASSLSLEFSGDRKNMENKLGCNENFSYEVQQVDRILGCRVRTWSSCIDQKLEIGKFHEESKAESDSENPQTKFPYSEFTSHHARLDECCDDHRVLDMKELIDTLKKGCQNGANSIAHKINDDGSTESDMEGNGKTLATSEDIVKTEIIRTLVPQPSVGHSMTSNVSELPEESVTGDENFKARAAEKASEGSIVEFLLAENCGDHQSVALADPCESEAIRVMTTGSESDHGAENVIQNEPMPELKLKENDSVTYEYFVKWVGKSNIHNSWVTEDQLKILAKRKLENYKAKYGTSIINICEEQWCQPKRIIALHESPHDGGEAFVKWCGLPYDECTWEKVDDPVVQSCCHLISEFIQFETQTLDNDARDDFVKVEIQEVVSLVEQPKELKGGLLFPHQLEALNWLRKCWHRSKNVILADEMGLGKTVSASSFMSSLYCEFKVVLPSLVLVPLSTMPNWLAEFASWAPHLNVVEYHGCAKARSIIREYEWHANNPDGLHKLTKSHKFNVLLTTYEMVLADSSHLRGVPWEVLVVDEGHRLKNSGSKLFNLLNTFSFQHRVLLTGTPLQNNIGEMYNLLNFLQPASFPSLSAFEENFDELTTAEKVEELKKLVAPHMLRRLKKDAMQNIPPKTERMVPVELTSIQAEYYRAMLTKNYQILRNIGKGVAQQSMLNIVMQLRKVCNHPYLIPGTEPESGTIDFLQEMRIKASAKLTLLHSMLKILHKDGHRVLIFSQMTKLLDILEDYLNIEFGNGTFERVDGSVSVTDRQAAITRFNQDKTRFVFLLSTRSCGLGINLATADTVIIYDSDFNPHADIQAMNRAHRIGQSNRLLVYRLVVRASVEERILQLAKKKLMLDQLFVNKSGSQKEVEDILRWGTEELFGDCDGANGPDSKDNSIGKVDTYADGEQKHRRKVGGLGDVYKDRCTDGGVNAVWDESAILKLLDRSDLQTVMTENADGDLDNDMLGSVKSLDWGDEQINEEPNNIEMRASLAADGHEPSLTKEEHSNTVTEENEWDRLLRIRWEKYQLKEEATLGRGKRTRKAVSYRETISSIPSEALIETANEDVEPERDYTPAGRALKEKYMKLRARQKERIKRMHTIELHSSAEGPESLKESAFPYLKEMQHSDSNKHLEDSRELDTSSIPDDSKDFQTFDVKNASFWISKKGRTMKHGSHLGHSVKPPDLSSDIIPPSNHLRSSSSRNCVPTSTLLPVLGLCAPNASQRHTSTRVLNSPTHQPAPNHELRRAAITASEFPSASTAIEQPSTSTNVAVEGKDSLIFSDTPEEALYRRLKNIIPDSYFPFGPPLPPTSERSPSDAIERLGTSFSSFREKLGLPNLVADDVPPLKFGLPSLSSAKLQTEFLPNLSSCSNIKHGNGSEMDMSNVPVVPSFGRQLHNKLKQKQLMPELPPILNLSLAQTAQRFPENHRKVLTNIMMRTQTSAHKFTNKRLKVDAWSEDELDALWIGVRRHGKGNWDAMLGDPKLKILKYRSVEELLSKWTEEQNKIMDGPVPPPKNSKSSLGLSDGMMTRALLGNKFAILGTELPKVCSHLTDIQLGCGDIMPDFPCLDPSSYLGATSESFLPLPSWQSDKLGSKYIDNVSTGPVDRLEKANLPLEQPFHHSSLSVNVEALGMNLSSSNSLQQKDDISARNKRIKLPSLLEKSLHLLRETQNIRSEGSSMGFLHDSKNKQAIYMSAVADDRVPDGSKASKLPHWLREAFSAPRHPEPTLPLSVSAISQSVRLLYGEDKSMFPPFVIPRPLPLPPKDPRERLRKKRKLHRLRQAIPHNSNTMGNVDISASCSIPAELNLLACTNPPTPPLMGYTIPPAPPLTPLSNPQAPSLTPSTTSSLAPYSILPESLVPFPIPSVPPLFPSCIPSTLSLLPSFSATTLPLMPSSLCSAPSMMPLKFPSTLPWLPSSIPQAPPLMHSCAQPPPALPSSILSVPTSLPSSISLSPSSILGSVPPLPQMMRCSMTAELPLMPCTIPLAPPLTASLPSIPRKEVGFILPSLNFNLNSPSSSSYSAQEMQPVANASPSPAVFQLVSPRMNHTPSLSSSSRPDMPSSSYPSSEVPASNIPEYSDRAGVALIGDFKNIDMKQKVIMSLHVGCVGKMNDEDVAQTESGKLGKTKSNLSLADDIKSILENSSEATVADDNRREQES